VEEEEKRLNSLSRSVCLEREEEEERRQRK